MQNDLIEQLKFLAEFLKHITTLSTGSLILLTIFLEKLSSQPRWTVLIRLALLGFALSLVASAIAFTGLLHFLPTTTGTLETGDSLWRGGAFSTFVGFLIGVVCLAVFAVANVQKKDSAQPSA